MVRGRPILAVRPERANKAKALLLGMSYPDVKEQMDTHGFDPDILVHKSASVDQAVECVRRGILTEMDARDLARCLATEMAGNVDVYTVSKEIGAVYRKDRHVHANFNARSFCATLREAFGEDIQFTQVILDYYWMPTGWLVTRWARTLFQKTLPDLVRYNLLAFPSKRRAPGKKKELEVGVVYLPFCSHCVKEVVGAIDVLSEYYQISFVKKQDLAGHALWRGTMQIDADTMQTRLGKRLDQEEVYCTFRPKDIYESMEDPHVSKAAVMKVLQAIPDYGDVRMIRLKPLRQHEPPFTLKERLMEPEKGGFIGLDYSRPWTKKFTKKGKAEVEESDEAVENIEAKVVLREEKELAKKEKVFKGEKTSKKDKHDEERCHRKQKVTKDDKGCKVEEIEKPSRVYPVTTLFYPCPAIDLETYIDPESCAENDKRQSEEPMEIPKNHMLDVYKRLTRTTDRKTKRSIAAKESENLAELHSTTQLQKSQDQSKGYLSSNPRCKPKMEKENYLDLNLPEEDYRSLVENILSTKEVRGASDLLNWDGRFESITRDHHGAQETGTFLLALYQAVTGKGNIGGSVELMAFTLLVCYKIPRKAIEELQAKNGKEEPLKHIQDSPPQMLLAVVEALRGDSFDPLRFLCDSDQRNLKGLKKQWLANAKKSPEPERARKRAEQRFETLRKILAWFLTGKDVAMDPNKTFASVLADLDLEVSEDYFFHAKQIEAFMNKNDETARRSSKKRRGEQEAKREKDAEEKQERVKQLKRKKQNEESKASKGPGKKQKEGTRIGVKSKSAGKKSENIPPKEIPISSTTEYEYEGTGAKGVDKIESSHEMCSLLCQPPFGSNENSKKTCAKTLSAETQHNIPNSVESEAHIRDVEIASPELLTEEKEKVRRLSIREELGEVQAVQASSCFLSLSFPNGKHGPTGEISAKHSKIPYEEDRQGSGLKDRARQTECEIDNQREVVASQSLAKNGTLEMLDVQSTEKRRAILEGVDNSMECSRREKDVEPQNLAHTTAGGDGVHYPPQQPSSKKGEADKVKSSKRNRECLEDSDRATSRTIGKRSKRRPAISDESASTSTFEEDPARVSPSPVNSDVDTLDSCTTNYCESLEYNPRCNNSTVDDGSEREGAVWVTAQRENSPDTSEMAIAEFLCAKAQNVSESM